MRIGNRYGHTNASPGTTGTIDEITEARKIVNQLNPLLRTKHIVIDCQPSDSTFYPEELNYGINKANLSNLDVYFSVHFNNAYNNYNGELGSEIWIYDRNSKLVIEKATAILKNLENLGFKNRGIKYLVETPNKSLGELENTNCEAMIIEVCFVEATKDVEAYKKAGVERVARAIANGLDNSIPVNSGENKEDYNMGNLVIYFSDGDRAAADLLALKLLCPTISKSVYEAKKVDAKNIYVVGGTWKPSADTILLSGNNRFATMQLVLNYKK